jgi:hypothetical protein
MAASFTKSITAFGTGIQNMVQAVTNNLGKSFSMRLDSESVTYDSLPTITMRKPVACNLGDIVNSSLMKYQAGKRTPFIPFNSDDVVDVNDVVHDFLEDILPSKNVTFIEPRPYIWDARVLVINPFTNREMARANKLVESVKEVKKKDDRDLRWIR